MKRREAAGPVAWPTVLNPYYFLVFLLPTLAEGFFTLSAASTVSLRQTVQRLAELVEEGHPASGVAKHLLRGNSSSDAVLLAGRRAEDGDVPDQLELNKATSAEREQAENIASELEKQILELARTGGPIPKGLLDQIAALVDRVLKPSVTKHHKEDKALLEHLVKDFRSCEKDQASSTSRTSEVDRVRCIKSQKHRQCRRREAQAYEETSQCNRALDLTSKVKAHVCNSIKDSRVGPADRTSTCIDRFCHYLPGENYEMYLRRISSYFQTKLDEFEKAKGACTEMSVQAEREVKACAKKDRWHKQKKQECDHVQESLERASCARATQTASSCDSYQSCFQRNDAAYKKLKPIISQREEDRKAEWKALKRIQCLMGTLADAKADAAEVEKCKKMAYDVSQLDLVFEKVPKQEKCLGSKNGAFKGRKVPCSKSYMKAEYGRLPRGARAQQCMPCSGPQEDFQPKSVPFHCKSVSCDWTLRHSCRGQPLGSRGLATEIDGPVNGYECCCRHKMWKTVKRRTSDASSVPIVTVARGGGPKPLGPDFWLKECQKVPKDAVSIKVVMGSAADYFKPRGSYSFCDMLTSGDKHLWSSDGVSWKKPDYYNSWGRLGGSAENWPKLKVNDDYRVHLSFWGDLRRKGGCCSSSKTKPYDGWGQGFTMSYVPSSANDYASRKSKRKAIFPVKVNAHAQAVQPVQVLPLPAANPPPVAVTQGCGLVMRSDLNGGPLDEAYWRKQCLEIPATAKTIRLVMGDFTDYFKPVPSASMCEMLTHRDLHMWSPDGEAWKTPAFYPSGSFLGGSSLEWPGSQAAKPERRYVSFWGHSYQRGGCCSSEKDRPYVGWAQYFVMEYCV
mmetsp:Transcript_7667/g.20647  ORF Transcript_7667/g.20647 Transcript_7667/m.20647 type:complete len:847 (-) Transcript_7667:58-2598(-)